jgi:hypothetical protein
MINKNGNKNLIYEEVYKTLHSLEDIKKTEVNPFFYTRLMGNLVSRQKQNLHSKYRVSIVNYLRPALLVLLVVINIIYAISFFQSGTNGTNESSENIKNFVKEYNLSQTDSYSIFQSK